MTIRTGLGVLAVMAAAGQAAFSQTVAYNSFRPGDAYDPGGTRISFTGSGTIAYPFTAAASGAVQWIDAGLVMSGSQPTATSLTFTVFADSGGLPGASRGGFSFVAPAIADPFQTGTPPPVQRYTPGSGIDLVAGQSYWLGIGFSNATFSNAPTWWTSDTTLFSRAAGLNSSTWSLRRQTWQTAFRVVVPAPGTAGAVIPLGLLATRRQRRSV